MSEESVYSVCGMCTVRCPIQVTTENGKVKFIQGNPHLKGIEGAICGRGAAGTALIDDHERPQYPMIRIGERGQRELAQGDLGRSARLCGRPAQGNL